MGGWRERREVGREVEGEGGREGGGGKGQRGKRVYLGGSSM